MAEKKTHTFVSASTGTSSQKVPAKKLGNSALNRTFAIICWLLAIAAEVVAIFSVFGKIKIGSLSLMVTLIIFLVVDLIFCVIGSLLWKKANHISPASNKNKVGFFLFNNLGMIMAVVCFLPLIIIVLTNKNTDKKTKTVATIVGVVCLALAGVAGFDFNPISKEELSAAQNVLGGQTVYWTKHGTVYHTSDECNHLDRSEELVYGTVEQATEAKKVRICKTCAKRDNINTEGMLVEDVKDALEDVTEEFDEAVGE